VIASACGNHYLKTLVFDYFSANFSAHRLAFLLTRDDIDKYTTVCYNEDVKQLRKEITLCEKSSYARFA
jgi:hypothetical protein